MSYSKWSVGFIEQFKETSTVKKLTDEINKASSKEKSQKNIDLIISEVCKGKHKRRGY